MVQPSSLPPTQCIPTIPVPFEQIALSELANVKQCAQQLLRSPKKKYVEQKKRSSSQPPCSTLKGHVSLTFLLVKLILILSFMNLALLTSMKLFLNMTLFLN